MSRPAVTSTSKNGQEKSAGALSSFLYSNLEILRPVKQAAYDSDLAIETRRRGCTQGTRAQVLAGLDHWLGDPASPPVCWLTGMSGTGKTTIAYTFCEMAEKDNLLAGSFFCTRTSAECRSLSRIIPTIAYQLAGYSTPYRAVLSKGLGSTIDPSSKHVLAQFAQLLKQPLQEVQDSIPKQLLVVIDGLDECEDRSGVGRILDTLFEYAPQIPLKFLIASQSNAEIHVKMTFHQQSREMMQLDEIEKSVMQADIELYLSEALEFLLNSPVEMEQLVQRSGIFFIYAATIVYYIASGKRSIDPHKRLRSILSPASDAATWYSPVDELYSRILKSALEEGEPNDILMVLHVVLLAQEPINIAMIAVLAGIDDPRRVSSALRRLGSVLHRPGTTSVVSTIHASFPEFMFEIERSGPFFCNVDELNYALADKCFSIMKEQLCFNICDLKTSFVLDNQIEDLPARVNNTVSFSLTYACRYWANYLGSSNSRRSEGLESMLAEFLCNQLLFWMEVLNLREVMIEGAEGLQRAEQWLKRVSCKSAKLGKFVEDAHDFVAGFAANPVSLSTPHIYTSSLPFCPRSSLVYQNYWKRVHGVLELNGSLMEHREVIALATWALSSNVLSVAYSCSGDQIVVGCSDKTVRLLSAYDGAELVTPLQGHTEIVHSVAFSTDGQFVVSGSYDGTVRVWNTTIGIPICAAPPQKLDGKICHVTSVSFSPDGRRVVSGSVAGTIRLLNALDGTPLPGPLEGHNDWIRCVTFSPDGTLIASASDDHTIRLWHSYSGFPASSTLEGHTHWVMSVAFSPDGTRLASGSRDHTIRVWNIQDGSLASQSIEGHTGTVYSVVISSDGTRVASGSGDGTIRVWNIDDGTLAAGPFRLIDHTGSAVLVTSVAFSPDGTRVISSAHNRAVHVWDLRYGSDTLASPPSMSHKTVPTISSLGFSPDSTHVLSSSPDSTIRLWNTRNGLSITGTGKGLLPSSSTSPFSPMYSSNGLYLACSFEGGVLHIMSMATGAIIARLTGAENRPLSAFRFSQDSSCIITGGSDGLIRVQNLRTRQILACSFIGHTGAVSSITQSLDSSLLASYSDEDKTIRIWDMLAPRLDLGNQSSSAPNPAVGSIHENSWHVVKNGWAVNNNDEILFWLPNDIAPVWRSPNASLIITENGTLQIPRQKLIIGSMWSKCYIP
ncbi:unnamed protein product [Rhizoctonia solani]|uniref:Nephrocystin 3-like N-terminal domain-containing protein n=1 Tax=Rhizoctonia solani TaxID=456999 RepID=A0A8H3E187_9AGAM|nr:unnamed protein product [Rhizoctonia solani]